MANQARTNQGGSVASFLIVGALLTVLVVGGVYFAQQRAQEPSSTPTPTPSPIVTTNQPSQPGASSPVVTPTPTPSSTPTTVPQTGTALPQTGPSDTFIALGAVAILLGVTIAYLQSYRYRFGSLRK